MRRFLKLVLRITAALIVVLVALYLMRGPLLARPLGSLVADQLSAALGGRFEIQRIEGNWFSNLSVVEMRTRESPAEGPLTRIEFGRATIEYDLLGLFRGDPVAAIKHVSLHGAQIEIDLTRHAPQPEEAEAVTELRELLGLLPEPFPDFEVQGRVRLYTAEGLIDLRGIHVEEEGRDGLRVRVARVTLPPIAAPTPDGRLDLLVRHERRDGLLIHMDEALAGIRIERAKIEDFDRFDAVVVTDAGAIQAELDGTRLTVAMQGFDLTRLPPWMPRQLPAAFEWPQSGRVTLDLDLQIDDPIQATARLAVDDLRWRDAIGEHIELDGSWSGNQGRISRLNAKLATGTVAVESLTVDARTPYFVTGANLVRVDVPDLAAVLAKLPLDADQRDRLAGLPRPIAVRIAVQDSEAGKLSVSELRIEGGGSSVSLTGAAGLPADPADWMETTLDLSLAATVGDPRPWSEDLPRVKGLTQVAGTVRGSLSKPDAALTVAAKDLRVDERAVERVDLDVALLWPALEVRSLALVAAAGRIDASGSADLEALTVGQSRFEVNVPDLEGLLALLPKGPAGKGSVEGQGTLAWDGQRLIGSISLDGNDLVFEGEELGNLQLRVSADGANVTVEQARLSGSRLEASVQGGVDLDAREATVEVLEARVSHREAKLTQPLRLRWGPESLELVGLELDALGGHLTGSARRGIDGWIGAMKLKAIDLSLLLEELDGRLDLELAAEGAGFTVSARVPEFGFEGQRGQLELDASQRDRGISLDRLELRAGDALTASGSGEIPLRLDLASGALVRLDRNDFPPRLTLSASISDASAFTDRVESGGAQFEIGADRDGLRAKVDLLKTVLRGRVELPSRTTLELSGGPAGMELLVNSEPDGIGELSGRIESDEPVVWTEPATLLRAFEKGRIKGKVEINLPDLTFVPRLVPQLRHLEGAARVDLTLSGALSAPSIVGDTTLSNLSTTLGGLPPVHELNGTLRFTPGRLEFAPVRGEIGYEPFELTGTVELPEAGAPIVDVALKGTNLLLVRERHLRVRADLDLTARGPLDALSAGGTVRITDGLFSEPIDIFAGGGARVADTSMQLFSVRSGPMAKAKLDIRLLGDESFRIRNNFVRGSLSFDLELKGTGMVPEPRGSIFLQETLVALPATSLKILQGEIRFPPDNPFAAVVELSGRTRMRGFDIDLRVSGVTPEMQVFLSSSPSLSQEDAYVLITTGSLPADYENEAGQRAALARAGAFVGKQFLSRLSGPSDPDQETLFDRIEVEVGRDMSRTGQETYEAEFRVKRPWFLRGERDRFDQYNFGVVWRFRFR